MSHGEYIRVRLDLAENYAERDGLLLLTVAALETDEATEVFGDLAEELATELAANVDEGHSGDSGGPYHLPSVVSTG